MKKNKIILLITICIFFILSICLIYNQRNNLYNAETKEELNEVVISNYTHLIVKGKITNTNNSYITIFTLNENDIAINTRTIYEFITESEAKQYYENLKKADMMSNISISGNIIKFNNSPSNGISKDKILKIYSSASEILEF